MFFSLDRVNGGSGFLTASFLGCLLVPAWHHLDLLPRKSTSHWRKILTTNLFWPLYREKMWICFCFFVANKIIVFFLFGSFFTSFWFTPGSNMEGFFNTFCSLEIRLFLSNQPGGERPPRRNDASKVGHSILPPRDFLFGTKIPWWVKGEMGVIHSP